MLRGRPLLRWLAAALVCAAPAIARADGGDDSGAVSNYEQQAKTLAQNLPTTAATQLSAANRLVNAEVAYTIGNYDLASSLLFDLVNGSGPDVEVATYYLAETLYHKGDRGAARSYYAQIVDKGGGGKYYVRALSRLVELAIAQNDATGVDGWIAAFDRLPAGARPAQVAYIRGKYAFWQAKYDDALTFFRAVPAGSPLELEAVYYTGTTYIAQKDLAKATEVFTDLAARKPRSVNDRRVIELAQLALGRVFYERDEEGKSIDAYLGVDRHSDLFRDALYEVAWVYVKGKQYDKALRVLELLAQEEPTSTRTPTVRLLEGNLRIRKAQAITAAQADGTLVGAQVANADPQIEYAKATAVFTETHDAFQPAYAALQQMIDSKADPARLLAQIAGRSSGAFQISIPLPDAAAEWLRDEPEVQRVVGIQTDLGDIRADITHAQHDIDLLEGALAAPNHTHLFPDLATRRARAAGLEDQLIKLRSHLADQQVSLLTGGQTASLTAQRQALATQFAQVGGGQAESQAAAHASADGAQFDASEKTADEVTGALDAAGAEAVALRMYQGTEAQPLSAQQRSELGGDLDSIGHDADGLERELVNVRQEIDLGRNLAGGHDDTALRAAALRNQVRAAQDQEHLALAGLVGASRDHGRAQSLAQLGDRAARVANDLAQLEVQIDQRVEQGLDGVRTEIAADKAQIAALQAELSTEEGESGAVGADVLGGSFAGVRDKLYDVVIRSDVGNIDVEWSQKEDADETLKRLNLERAREVKQLHDEFRDILDDHAAKPSEVKHQVNIPPPSGGSTDQGNGAGGRIKPIEDAPPTNGGPAAVKPDPNAAGNAGKTTPPARGKAK